MHTSPPLHSRCVHGRRARGAHDVRVRQVRDHHVRAGAGGRAAAGCGQRHVPHVRGLQLLRDLRHPGVLPEDAVRAGRVVLRPVARRDVAGPHADEAAEAARHEPRHEVGPEDVRLPPKLEVLVQDRDVPVRERGRQEQVRVDLVPPEGEHAAGLRAGLEAVLQQPPGGGGVVDAVDPEAGGEGRQRRGRRGARVRRRGRCGVGVELGREGDGGAGLGKGQAHSVGLQSGEGGWGAPRRGFAEKRSVEQVKIRDPCGEETVINQEIATTTQRSTAQHSTAQHGSGQHGTEHSKEHRAQHSTA